MVRGVVFDFRDTLVDVNKANQAVGRTLHQLLKSNLPNLSYAQFKRNFALARHHTITQGPKLRIHNWTAVNLDNLLAYYKLKLKPNQRAAWLKKLDDAFVAACRLYPEAGRILSWLQSQNIKIGVTIDGTSYRENGIIKKLKLKPYFQAIVISEKVGWNKFTWQPLAQTLHRLKLKPKDVIVIGDRPDKDIKWANHLGCLSVKIERQSGRYHSLTAKSRLERPLYHIRSLTELKGLILIST